MEIHFWFFARVPVLHNQKNALHKGKQIIGIYFMIIYINFIMSSLLNFSLIHSYLLKSLFYRGALKSHLRVP